MMNIDGARRPRVLTLWAHEGSPNLGVAALARGSQDLIRRVAPGAQLTFANYGSRPAQLPWGRPRSLLKEHVLQRQGMAEYLGGFDLIWDTRSGDSFADIYGLERHVTMSLVHEFAYRAGTPIMLAPQTIGPFRSKRGRIFARRTLSHSAAVFTRDAKSAEESTHLGRPPDRITADLVFGIDVPAAGARRDVLLNVSGLLWTDNPHVDAAAYRSTLVELVLRLQADGREVTLFAHVLDSDDNDNDVPAVRDLERLLSGTVDTVIPRDLDDARQTIAGSALVVGSRMHACLNALSVGVPAIPLAYSRKFRGLMEGVGWTDVFDLRFDDASSLATRVVATAGRVTAADAHAAAVTGRISLDPLTSVVASVLA